jgi:hypothetical protein
VYGAAAMMLRAELLQRTIDMFVYGSSVSEDDVLHWLIRR